MASTVWRYSSWSPTRSLVPGGIDSGTVTGGAVVVGPASEASARVEASELHEAIAAVAIRVARRVRVRDGLRRFMVFSW